MSATISEEEIKELMDAESWISPTEALQYGFATQIMADKSTQPSQSVKNMMMQKLREKVQVEPAKEPPAEQNIEPAEEPAEPKKKTVISLFNREVK